MTKIPRPTDTLFDTMVSLYRRFERDNPRGVTLSTHTQVARILHLTSDVARRAWHKGWPSEKKGVSTLLPIKDLIFRERVLARGKRNGLVNKLIDRRLEAAEQAVDDAAQSRALEGLAVRQQMAVASELQSNTHQMLLASAQMRDSVIRGIQALADNPDTPISKRLQIMNTLSEIAERDSKTLERAQTLERRFMGEVESRQRVEGQEQAEATPERVYDDLAGLFKALGLGSRRELLAGQEEPTRTITLQKQDASYAASASEPSGDAALPASTASPTESSDAVESPA